MLLLTVIGLAVAICVIARLDLFHTSVYTVSSSAGAQADVDMPASTDPAVTIVNGHPIFESNVQAVAAYGTGDASLTQLKLSTPKLRATSVYSIQPLDVAAAPTNGTPFDELFRRPLQLNQIDENQLLVTNTVPGGATPLYGAVWFHNGVMNTPPGDMFEIVFTATITSVANNWVSGAITLATPLPAGVYSVIGMSAWCTAGLFGRLIFPSQSWRPGIIMQATAAGVTTRYMRYGRLGEYGRFNSFAQPNFDLYASTAGSKSVTGWLQIVRTSGPMVPPNSNLINTGAI